LHQKGYKLSIAIFSKQYVIGKFSILTARWPTGRDAQSVDHKAGWSNCMLLNV
jgi:hypothetical protein